MILKTCKNTSILFVILSFLCGCQQTLNSANMVPHDIDEGVRIPYPLDVVVEREWVSENFFPDARIEKSHFTEGLNLFLANSNLYKKVHQKDTEYRLKVVLLSTKATGSIRRTLDLLADWHLIELRTGKHVFNEPIKSTFTAGARDAFNGYTRNFIVVEGAIRENIRKGLSLFANFKIGTDLDNQDRH